MRRNVSWFAATVLALGLSVGVASAQTSKTSETKKFTVIAVDGNQLVVRLPEGTKEITVPEDFRFTVNGQSMSVHDLKPGMSGTAVITTTTTVKPVTVTEVRNATVQQVAGSTIIVRGQNGFRMFTQGDVDKRNVRIMKDGKPVSLSELHTGDHLTATIVTEKPPQVMTQRQVDASLAAGGPEKVAATSGAAAAPPPPPPARATGTGTGAGAAAPAPPPAPAAKKLPKTASPLPLVGLIGLAALSIGVALSARRRRRI
jgi:LPXTG-motif cell wall-anchored protein